MSNHKLDLLKCPIGPTLVKLTIPMMMGLLAIFLFNIVDTLFVGQLGTKELAAMGFTFPVIFVIMSITMGIGMGTTSVISRAIGHGDKKRIRRLATDGLFLAMVLVLICSVVGITTIDPLFKLLGASEETIPLIKDYMFIWYIAVFFLVVPMVGNSAIRATGDTKTPSIIMISAGVVNVILDPLLIFGIGPFPRMELQGAALATAIAWFTTFVAGILVLHYREKMISFRIPALSEVKQSWKEILYVGIPAAGTNVLGPIATGIIISMLSGFGEEAVAAFGVGIRLESLALIGAFGLSTAIMPLIGQNFGAEKYERVKEALSFGNKYSLQWGFIAFIILAVLSSFIARIFNDDPAVISYIILFLIIVPISYGFYGVAVIVGSFFNAINRPMSSALLMVIRLFVFMIPLAYLGSVTLGVMGILIGVSASYILSGIVSYFYAQRCMKKPHG